MNDFFIRLNALKDMEQEELRVAVRKYGTKTDNSYEYTFKENKPIIAGYFSDYPTDMCIDKVEVNLYNNLNIIGTERESGSELKITHIDEIFPGEVMNIIEIIELEQSKE